MPGDLQLTLMNVSRGGALTLKVLKTNSFVIRDGYLTLDYSYVERVANRPEFEMQDTTGFAHLHNAPHL
eukprot:scaffold33569_cov84-Skeletonema_dohrnii-CCMP3373.AAC.10